MDNLNIQEWVDAEKDAGRREFRQAIHLFLRAIANSELTPFMIMKGGILLAIRYKSQRFTKDIDFSTSRKLQDIDLDEFLLLVSKSLVETSKENDYGLVIALQSHKINPPNRPEVSFPTLQLKVGYASRFNSREMQKLGGKQSPKVIQVDYSFNEWASTVELNSLDGGVLNMYAYHDLVAEKIRSVLQQPIRNRSRFQDIYDLSLLLEGTSPTEEDKHSILTKLESASAEREVLLSKMAMRNPEVIELSRKDFSSIKDLIGNEPLEFEATYAIVQDFFESLPWPNGDAITDSPATQNS